MNDEKQIPESFKTYEEGKHRRYTLFFAVNGGAFALAKLITGKDPSTASIGDLKLSYLCYGMALFTMVMSMDIFMFGQKMRKMYLPGAFAWQGKLVLMLISALMCLGWVLAAPKGHGPNHAMQLTAPGVMAHALPAEPPQEPRCPPR